MPSNILYQNSSATITVIDIPRSIELAQGNSSKSRLISSKPLEHPYPSVDAKSAKAKANVGEASLQDLLLVKYLELALDEVKGGYQGPWCLPRVIEESESAATNARDGVKRQRVEFTRAEPPMRSTGEKTEVEADHVQLSKHCKFFHNSEQTTRTLSLGFDERDVVIPPMSTFLHGDISDTLSIFEDHAPEFDLVVLDPPWPNRSARRKQSYRISYGNAEIRSLLSSLPLCGHLTHDGYVAVWITNKPSLREMIAGEGGLFKEWDVQLVEEWTWLKVTSNGEPICALDSTWRKPYEVLLVGRRGVRDEKDVKKRVIMGVPDLHSRKPNLKTLFEGMMGKEDGYEALEIFARNLTAGWWSWGNEVLKFQTSEHWADP